MKKILFVFVVFIAFASTVWAFCEPVKVKYEDGIYYIVLDGKKVEKKIKFVASEKLITNNEAHKQYGSLLTINAGFFDPNNQKTISYIVTDKAVVADPYFNERLLLNPVLRQNIDKIVNRTEFRVVECDGKIHYEITPHNSPIDFTCTTLTSAQGGPMILPELKLEEEFFVITRGDKIVRDSASMLIKEPRTIIGLKGDDIYILIITNKNPKTIYEVQELCRKLGLERAMAFDGGSSTSLNYKKSIDIVSTKDAGGRMLKSFMIVGK